MHIFPNFSCALVVGCAALSPLAHALTPAEQLSLATLLTTGALSTLADSKGPMVPPLPKYKAECAACHTAYPAGMLPAPSWKRLMVNLNKHYGTDASLDEASVREISGWLQTNAGTYKQVRPQISGGLERALSPQLV